MSDLTVIFLTVNKVPQKWAEFHKKVLMEAIGDYPLITVSRLPAEGINLLQTEPFNPANIYRQMLRAAKVAETPYVAIVEDDTLYPKEHFEWRPDKDKFGYNMSRWGILSWRENPHYYYRHRESNSTLIAPRELLIECLSKYPEGFFGEPGKERINKKLKLNYQEHRWHSFIPIVNFAHINAVDELEQQKRKGDRKALIAYDIPKWGRAEDLIKKFV